MSIERSWKEKTGQPTWQAGWKLLERKSTEPKRSKMQDSINSVETKHHMKTTHIKLDNTLIQPHAPTTLVSSQWKWTLPTLCSCSKNSQTRNMPSTMLRDAVSGAALRATWPKTVPRIIICRIEQM
jgi:hypothetical protein